MCIKLVQKKGYHYIRMHGQHSVNSRTVVHNLLHLERTYLLMNQLLATRHYNCAHLFCVGGKLGILGKGRKLAEEDLEQDGEKRVKMRKL